METKAVFWHRRDLRIHDNAGLFAALKTAAEVFPVFIFDTSILNHLEPNDQRVLFIYRQIQKLKQEYRDLGSDLQVLYGDPLELIPQFCNETRSKILFANKDYEPAAIKRDAEIYKMLKAQNIDFKAKKDQVIFEKSEVVKADGLPYTVFTPYMRKWKETLTDFHLKSYPNEVYFSNLAQISQSEKILELQEMGFDEQQGQEFPRADFDLEKIKSYAENRDIPALDATSKLGIHLRFGTISIRELARKALQTNEKYFNELIWRDFYHMILYHFPHAADGSFKKQYDRIQWINNETQFELWCVGLTGFPLVDAGMRELNQTGFMHNRVRMVVASFLCKHLLIDWRWGERYFAQKLLDFDLASNSGGWQWAAGSGCDAAPYFRVFSPKAQQEKFDPDFEYIRRWIPEFGTKNYPDPIVDHDFARKRAVEVYRKGLQA